MDMDMEAYQSTFAVEPPNPESGELSLSKLLSSLQPTLQPTTYVFARVFGILPDSSFVHRNLASTAIMFFDEQARGAVTFVMPAEVAKNSRTPGLTWDFECRQITIDVHSGLAAVGFMPVLTGALAARGISCNPVSAFYSDHLFVPADRADEAVETLMRVKDDAKAKAGHEAR